MSLADKSTVIEELPSLPKTYYKTQNPLKELLLLCTHEYMYIQQKELVENLLSIGLYEGVAEFISCNVTNTKSRHRHLNLVKLSKNLCGLRNPFTHEPAHCSHSGH